MEDDLERVSAYIKESLRRGYSEDHIKQTLIAVGWKIEIINQAFLELSHAAKADLAVSLNASRVKSEIAFKMWLFPIIIAVSFFIIFSTYEFFRTGDLTFSVLSAALAGTAAVCIGFSFALSGMSYYFNFLDHELAYRKNLGLTGYSLALLYSFSLLFINPGRYFSGFFENLISYDFILGLAAMGILTLMAVVSNNFVMRKIGAYAWRFILRLGYLAYFLLILRAVVIDGDSWLIWLQRFDNLPPPRFLVSIFAIFVIGLRVSMEISIRRKNLMHKSLPAGETKENLR